MQPKKQLKVQYNGIFEEKKLFLLTKNALLERGPKIRAWVDPPPYSGNARKKTFFFIDAFPKSDLPDTCKWLFSQLLSRFF